MELLGTLMAGTVAAPLGNLLLDVNAAVSSLVWIIWGVLLAWRSGVLIALDPPPAARAPRPAVVVEREGEAFLPRKAA